MVPGSYQRSHDANVNHRADYQEDVEQPPALRSTSFSTAPLSTSRTGITYHHDAKDLPRALNATDSRHAPRNEEETQGAEYAVDDDAHNQAPACEEDYSENIDRGSNAEDEPHAQPAAQRRRIVGFEAVFIPAEVPAGAHAGTVPVLPAARLVRARRQLRREVGLDGVDSRHGRGLIVVYLSKVGR